MKSIFIEKNENCTRIALKLNNELEKLFIQEKSLKPKVGQIYLGIVESIVSGNECAYIDIGFEKKCYMHLKDSRKDNLKKGDYLLVEILKEELLDKGAKVTNNISIQGVYCVITTFNDRINFSKSIEDKLKKKEFLTNIKKPEDVGIIVRTRGFDADFDCINREIKTLYDIYMKIKKKAPYMLKPKLLYDNGEVFYRVLREEANTDLDEIITNDKEYYLEIKEFLYENENSHTKAEIYNKRQNLFSYFGIEKDIIQLKNDKVYLKSGAYIVINKTEAMNVIDVNSGKNTRHETKRSSILNSNLEAAKEAARQVILRNLSGIIVVDFIDMFSKEDKDKVLKVLDEEFKRDNRKTKVYPFTQLGLIQIKRKRTDSDIYSYIDERCPRCKGSGRRIKLSYISFLIKNEIYKIEEQLKLENVYIEIDKEYKKDISGDIIKFVKEIDAFDKRVYINYIQKGEVFKVEPLIFESKRKNLEAFKVYDYSN
ncbi:Rne/Rng family ribonuclease [Haloimpatiens sp. FM7315]|uniref:Rne/Rng family ribonuclease n=1 Tax=Haloimpatiens sp. FM7315 TaxID=3298609 RepID=UPI003977999B